jgi:D-methionine transport system permease protein
MWRELASALADTLYMVSASTFFSVVFGFVTAVAMVLTRPGGLRPNAAAHTALDLVVNLLRSFPFVILMIAIIPLTRFLAGTSIGSTASIVPLTVAATPFVARIIEGSLLGVDPDVIEAARSFGARDLQVVFGVMVREATPSIILDIAIVAVNLVGYSAMAGALGGGGLGDLAIRYGYNRFQTDIMVYSIIVLIVVVQLIQRTGTLLSRKIR